MLINHLQMDDVTTKCYISMNEIIKFVSCQPFARFVTRWSWRWVALWWVSRPSNFLLHLDLCRLITNDASFWFANLPCNFFSISGDIYFLCLIDWLWSVQVRHLGRRTISTFYDILYCSMAECHMITLVYI